MGTHKGEIMTTTEVPRLKDSNQTEMINIMALTIEINSNLKIIGATFQAEDLLMIRTNILQIAMSIDQTQQGCPSHHHPAGQMNTGTETIRSPITEANNIMTMIKVRETETETDMVQGVVTTVTGAAIINHLIHEGLTETTISVGIGDTKS